MKNQSVMFSTGKDDWQTPRDLFDRLNREFEFELDVAADDANALCPLHFTKESDALKNDWRGRRCFMNPPYSQARKWVAKAAEEASKGATVVCLLPARTDTKMFHDYIYDTRTWRPRTGVDVRFLKGRLKFVGAKSGAPFPSMIVIFHPKI